ncbi:hypothetical protein [Rathayibacter sp. AY1F7]|uniref:hypothetical protein n=1 Tax=Rathayibacter sp. AY1F7 TaxID=2080561 RepID=UPI0035BE33E5
MNEAITLSAGVVKRPHTLADGRELLYFDDADTTLPPERAADARHLDGPARGERHERGEVLAAE